MTNKHLQRQSSIHSNGNFFSSDRLSTENFFGPGKPAAELPVSHVHRPWSGILFRPRDGTKSKLNVLLVLLHCKILSPLRTNASVSFHLDRQEYMPPSDLFHHTADMSQSRSMKKVLFDIGCWTTVISCHIHQTIRDRRRRRRKRSFGVAMANHAEKEARGRVRAFFSEASAFIHLRFQCIGNQGLPCSFSKLCLFSKWLAAGRWRCPAGISSWRWRCWVTCLLVPSPRSRRVSTSRRCTTCYFIKQTLTR